MCWGCVALQLGAACAWAETPGSAAPTTAPWAKAGLSREGAWGRMELVPIALELPEAYATAERARTVRDRWNFAGLDRASALSLMRGCGFTPAQLAVVAADDWREAAGSCSVEPSDGLVLSLSPTTRAALYRKLMADPANASAISPSWFRAGRVDFRIRGSGLSEASIALLNQLMYPGTDDTLLLNDNKVALRAIADPAERMRFLMAITRKRALLARVVIAADTDTAALAEYWGRGGRAAEMLPLLNAIKFNAIAGVEAPGKVNITALLPPFAQQRLYRHPEPAAAGRTPDDCYWTAFNFFSETPDDRVHEPAYLAAMLRSSYVRIAEPTQLGDVILITAANGDAIHAANFIAEDVVFTKNGESVRQPWILADLRDVITQYTIKNATVGVAYFRKR